MMDWDNLEIRAEELLTELGFGGLDREGVIYSHVLEDPTISIEAKGIYGILSSLEPLDNSESLSLAKLSTIANISPTTLLKYRQELINAGYLTIQIQPPFNNGPRTYTLHHEPKQTARNANREKQPDSVHECAQISCKVMATAELTLREKGMYTYLKSLNGRRPPSVKDTAQMMNIHYSRIYHYCNHIRQLGLEVQLPVAEGVGRPRRKVPK